MEKLEITAFASKIATLKQAISLQGKSYHSIRVANQKVYFIRSVKQTTESIDLQELYNFYLKVPYPTNKEARDYITGRVQSPAVSILNALSNNSSEKEIPDSNNEVQSLSKVPKHADAKAEKEKDETLFFKAFAEVIGANYLNSKSIGKPVTSSHLFLNKDFRDFGFTTEINQNFTQLLNKLQSNFLFGSASLVSYVDGFISKHPILGYRIVEFDEEQHFTPALKEVLNIQEVLIKNAFCPFYNDILSDIEFLNEHACKKHRIKHRFTKFPASFQDFISSLSGEKVSGYIEPKENGFPNVGGRIAQRAYYDTLRNVAHLSPKNEGLKAALRFPKKFFEDATKQKFNTIEINRLKTLIQAYLQIVYSIKLN